MHPNREGYRRYCSKNIRCAIGYPLQGEKTRSVPHHHIQGKEHTKFKGFPLFQNLCDKTIMLASFV